MLFPAFSSHPNLHRMTERLNGACKARPTESNVSVSWRSNLGWTSNVFREHRMNNWIYYVLCVYIHVYIYICVIANHIYIYKYIYRYFIHYIHEWYIYIYIMSYNIYYIILYYIVLYCIILYYIILYYIILYIISYHIILYYIILSFLWWFRTGLWWIRWIYIYIYKFHWLPYFTGYLAQSCASGDHPGWTGKNTIETTSGFSAMYRYIPYTSQKTEIITM